MILDLTKKLTITGFLAVSVYLLCNMSVYALFAMSVILPIFLMFAHYFEWSFATPKDRLSNKFDSIKLIAFSLQNFLAFWALYIDNQLMLTIVVNVAFRLNILDMMRQCYQDKNYMYAITGVPLLCWPIFDAQFHPQFLLEVTNVSSNFVFLYLLWVGGTVLKVGKGHATVILHPLLPLLFPNNLWFAARTFTGVNLIWMLFFKPTFDNLADTGMHTQKIQEFSKMYDTLFPLIFFGMMVQLLLNYFGFFSLLY